MMGDGMGDGMVDGMTIDKSYKSPHDKDFIRRCRMEFCTCRMELCTCRMDFIRCWAKLNDDIIKLDEMYKIK
jgi:hypothetical protein